MQLFCSRVHRIVEQKLPKSWYIESCNSVICARKNISNWMIFGGVQVGWQGSKQGFEESACCKSNAGFSHRYKRALWLCQMEWRANRHMGTSTSRVVCWSATGEVFPSYQRSLVYNPLPEDREQVIHRKKRSEPLYNLVSPGLFVISVVYTCNQVRIILKLV